MAVFLSQFSNLPSLITRMLRVVDTDMCRSMTGSPGVEGGGSVESRAFTHWRIIYQVLGDAMCTGDPLPEVHKTDGVAPYVFEKDKTTPSPTSLYCDPIDSGGKERSIAACAQRKGIRHVIMYLSIDSGAFRLLG